MIGELGLTADEVFKDLVQVENKFEQLLQALSECELSEEMSSKVEVCKKRFEANKLRPSPPKLKAPKEKSKIIRIVNNPGEVGGGAPGSGKRS
jgi:hypothetical protein